MLLPACDAVMVQVPAATRVSVVPLAEHVAVGLAVNSTVSPELAVAESVAVVPTVWVPSVEKLVIVWVCSTAKL